MIAVLRCDTAKEAVAALSGRRAAVRRADGGEEQSRWRCQTRPRSSEAPSTAAFAVWRLVIAERAVVVPWEAGACSDGQSEWRPRATPMAAPDATTIKRSAFNRGVGGAVLW
jgi:hypothetical protein